MSKTWTEEQFVEAVKNSSTIAEVLRRIGLSPRPGNYRTFHTYVLRLHLDTSHFTGQAHGTSISPRTIPLEDILIENSTYRSIHRLKPRLIKAGLLEYECAVCTLSEWREKELVLILDHINGVHNDHRITNLRFLCPNCNSLEPTFCRGSKGMS